MKYAKAFLLISSILTFGLITPPAWGGVTLTPLVSFAGTNGADPAAELLQANDGNFYGTTDVGGDNDQGTVYQMTPSGGFTVLFSFNQTNGATPSAALIQGNDGFLYGTTVAGGTNDQGTVFKVSTNGVPATLTLVCFNGTNGARPRARLLQGMDGSFYGTTELGGSNGLGTVFQLTTNGTLRTLVSFQSSDGYQPSAGLVQTGDGNLYGTASYGASNGVGAVFRVTTNGALTTLYSFTGGSDGSTPLAGLTPGSDGNLYGTTLLGGTNGYGTVYRIATNGNFMSLVSFARTNGSYPHRARLVQGSDGSFYGTTQSGGSYTNFSSSGDGTVFRVTTNGILTSLISFNATNGASPLAGLVQAADGSFYGAANNGSANNFGDLFRLVVPPPPVFLAAQKSGSTLTMLWSATVGQNYQLIYGTNLNQTSWSNLDGIVTATNATMTTLDSITADPKRFYRLILLP